MIPVDGVIYAPAGQTTALTPLRATTYSNSIMNRLKSMREHIEGDTTWLHRYLRERGCECDGNLDWHPVLVGDSFGILATPLESDLGQTFLSGGISKSLRLS